VYDRIYGRPGSRSCCSESLRPRTAVHPHHPRTVRTRWHRPLRRHPQLPDRPGPDEDLTSTAESYPEVVRIAVGAGSGRALRHPQAISSAPSRPTPSKMFVGLSSARATYHGETVTLGIGSDPATVRTVLDSIRYDPTAPDSPAGGGCPWWVRTAMSRSIRTMTTRTFDGLSQLVDLRPSPKGAVSVVSAAAAWEVARHGRPAPGVSYQVLLGREALQWRAVKVGGRFTSVPAAQLTLVWGSTVSAAPPHTSTAAATSSRSSTR
jgi:hypothetical protein